MCPSKRQIEVLKAQKKDGTDRLIAHLKLGITQDALHASNTRIFQELITDLENVTDYYPIFEGRFLDNEYKVRELLLKLNRQIRDSAKKKKGRRELR